MSKAKMKFPRVPGNTLRERFMNLARHVITLPKTAVDDRAHEPPDPKRRPGIGKRQRKKTTAFPTH
jgi:hypothetical protein